MSYPCPCCGNLTLDEESPGSFDICPVCYWEDDLVQFNDPTYSGGANKVSLEVARKNYLEFGACEREFISLVRKPKLDEEP